MGRIVVLVYCGMFYDLCTKSRDCSGGRGAYIRYWSATPNGKAKAFRLGVASTNWVAPDGAWNKWDAFTVRCVVK